MTTNTGINMDPTQFIPDYTVCSHIERKKVHITVDEDLITNITRAAPVLPLFEEKLDELKHKKNGSLVNNKFLKCRWDEFVKRIVPTDPFQFPCVNDFHFVRCAVRYEPKESINNRVNNRLHLTTGPGVDKFGQMPVPDNLHLRKTVYVPPRDRKTSKKALVKASKQ